MKTFLALATLVISTSAFSAVVKSYDAKNLCSIYKAVTNESNGKPKLNKNETVIFERNIYGFAFKNLEIDFENRQAKVSIELSVVAGFNRTLFKRKSIIQESNPKFTTLINILNRKVVELETICVNAENEIIYAELKK